MARLCPPRAYSGTAAAGGRERSAETAKEMQTPSLILPRIHRRLRTAMEGTDTTNGYFRCTYFELLRKAEEYRAFVKSRFKVLYTLQVWHWRRLK